MPFPRTLARLNRVSFNPVIVRVSGKVGPLAIMIHRGRTSGNEHRTPILAFSTGDGFVIALIYGRNTDWERNVLSAGGGDLVYRNTRYSLVAPKIVGSDKANPAIPLPVGVVLRLINVDSFLTLDRT